MYKSKKSNVVIAVILFLIAAVFLVYGIYMVSYSIDYIRSYMEISTITPVNAFQYVVTSSATYFGFAVTIFAGGFIILSMGGSERMKNNEADETEKAEEPQKDEELLFPESNPYYTSAPLKETEAEIPLSNKPNIPKEEPDNDLYKETVRAFSKLPKAPAYKDVIIPLEEEHTNNETHKHTAPIDKEHETELLEKLDEIKTSKLPDMEHKQMHEPKPVLSTREEVHHEAVHKDMSDKWVRDFFESSKNKK